MTWINMKRFHPRVCANDRFLEKHQGFLKPKAVRFHRRRVFFLLPPYYTGVALKAGATESTAI
jgi:hypothetical protein